MSISFSCPYQATKRLLFETKLHKSTELPKVQLSWLACKQILMHTLCSNPLEPVLLKVPLILVPKKFGLRVTMTPLPTGMVTMLEDTAHVKQRKSVQHH